jgi:RNA polymerase sigma-70 factor (ECF subfamily)
VGPIREAPPYYSNLVGSLEDLAKNLAALKDSTGAGTHYQGFRMELEGSMQSPKMYFGKPFSLSMKGRKLLEAEFELIALPQLSHLYTAALYLTKDKAEAEDLVQETYLRAFRFFDKFQPGTNCRAWLLSILRKLFINRYRQRRQEPQTVDWEKIDRDYESIVEEGERGNPESLIFSKVMSDEVEETLRGLPEEFRTAIVLVHIEELSYEEAAKVIGCPIGTVRSRVSRGRRILQVALRDYALPRWKGLEQKREERLEQ